MAIHHSVYVAGCDDCEDSVWGSTLGDFVVDIFIDCFYAVDGFHRFENLQSWDFDVWEQGDFEGDLEVDQELIFQ